MPIYRYPQEIGTPEYPHTLRITVHKRYSQSISETPAAIPANARGTAGARTANASTLVDATAVVGSVQLGRQVAGNLGGFAGAILGIALPVPKDSYNLNPQSDHTIYLPATSPKIAYSTNWSALALGPLVNNFTGVEKATDILDSGKATLGYYIMSEASKQTPLGSPGAAVQSRLGFSLNPYAGQIFNGNNYRSFAFTYKFLPKNKNELDQVNNIIKVLRANMLGYYNNLNILYPSEFKLSYLFENSVNPVVEQTQFCALTQLDINYGDGTDFVTFSDGSPAEVNITMNFVETQLMSRGNFLDNAGNEI